jgi:hypothetical protein
MVISKLKKINKLARDIAWEIDGLLDGDEPEKKIFRTAIRIVNLTERKSIRKGNATSRKNRGVGK